MNVWSKITTLAAACGTSALIAAGSAAAADVSVLATAGPMPEVLGSLEALLALSESELVERVAAISVFGPKLVENVRAFMTDPERRALLERLEKLGVSHPQPHALQAAEGPLSRVTSAEALPGRGLAGDRYADGAGTFSATGR